MKRGMAAIALDLTISFEKGKSFKGEDGSMDGVELSFDSEFDYGQVEHKHQITLHQSARRIRDIHRDATTQIGRELQRAKSLLPHGQFTDWVVSAVGMPARTATYYMRVASLADETKSAKFADLPPSTIDQIAKLPDEHRRVLMSELEGAVDITPAAVRDLIAGYKKTKDAALVLCQMKGEIATDAYRMSEIEARKAAAIELRVRLERHFTQPEIIELIALWDASGGPLLIENQT